MQEFFTVVLAVSACKSRVEEGTEEHLEMCNKIEIGWVLNFLCRNVRQMHVIKVLYTPVTPL